MSDTAAQPWQRLRFCSRLFLAASIASLVVFAFSLIASLVVFSTFNSWVVAISGGGLTISGNSSIDSGIASHTVRGPIQLHMQESAHRFAECGFHLTWREYGFRQINIPIYFIFFAFAALTLLARHYADRAAAGARICRRCGYPRPIFVGRPTRCSECGVSPGK